MKTDQPLSLKKRGQGRPSGPGIALKELRRSQGWTLLDVVKKTGVPLSTLSRIENGKVSPTYDVLMRLSTGLKIDPSSLLTGSPPGQTQPWAQSGRRSINRLGEGQLIDMGNHLLRYQSTDLLGKQIIPIIAEYHAKSIEEFGPYMYHSGEEYLFVLEGELELHTECYSPVVLCAGESIYFDSRMGHAYVARTQPCRALSICTAPLD